MSAAKTGKATKAAKTRKAAKKAGASNGALFEYLLRLGDDRLVLGQRLGEWCAHGPYLEEDIAMTNIALDYIGQAKALLGLAGEIEGAGRSADDLAMKRFEIDFRNCLLVEQPNGDFAHTMTREFLFSTYDYLLCDALQNSEHETLAALAGKGLKEAQYHLRHSREWMLRMGDGTDESHERAQKAVSELWRFTGELFLVDDVEQTLADEGIVPTSASLEERWREIVLSTLDEATLSVPGTTHMIEGGRVGKHGEHLGHMLAQMQYLARSVPDGKWELS